MMTMDSTQAKTGRLMKNWAMDQTVWGRGSVKRGRVLGGWLKRWRTL
jgi:hypothetical protein